VAGEENKGVGERPSTSSGAGESREQTCLPAGREQRRIRETINY
jgi:hypothetical protein